MAPRNYRRKLLGIGLILSTIAVIAPQVQQIILSTQLISGLQDEGFVFVGSDNFSC